MRHFILLLTLALSSSAITAQNVQFNKRQLPQKVYPKGFDNHSYGILYYNEKEVFNPRNYRLCTDDLTT